MRDIKHAHSLCSREIGSNRPSVTCRLVDAHDPIEDGPRGHGPGELGHGAPFNRLRKSDVSPLVAEDRLTMVFSNLNAALWTGLRPLPSPLL